MIFPSQRDLLLKHENRHHFSAESTVEITKDEPERGAGGEPRVLEITCDGLFL